MTAKIIAENILDADDFLSATEQEGVFIGQPVPASDNAGAFRLLSKGTPADFSYDGTADDDGSTTTIIDSALSAFGDDYFVGATIEFTAGENPNLVSNGGFDSDTTGWVAGNAASLSCVGGGKAGNCLQITENGHIHPVAYQAITVVPGATVRMTAYAKAGTEAEYMVGLYDNDNADWIVLSDWATESNGDWSTVVQEDAVIPSGCTTARVYLYSRAQNGEGKTFLFDSVSVCYTPGTKTVTDFDQATGTLTWSGALNSTLTGDEFTLTLPFATRDFAVELVSGGDASDATFKFSHDGTTYFGRDDIDQATWLDKIEIEADEAISNAASSANRFPVVVNGNGEVLLFYYQRTTVDVGYKKLGADGITWDSFVAVAIDASGGVVLDAIRLSSGRILVWYKGASSIVEVLYSDDEGDTWTQGPTVPDEGHISFSVMERADGALVSLSNFAGDTIVYSRISNDGFSWGSLISGPTCTASGLDSAILNDGTILAFYSTAAGVIKSSSSTDGGGSFGNEVTMVSVGGIIQNPTAVVDIDGSVYIAMQRANLPTDITFVRTTDDGGSFSAEKTIYTGAHDADNPTLSLVITPTGPEIWCVFCDETTVGNYGDVTSVKRGMWEAFSANACPVPSDATPIFLPCRAEIVFHGGAGVAADDWSFTPDYYYSMKNLIEHSPSKPFQSTQDNIECNIVLDLGQYERFRATGVAFFGCNVRAVDFQMHTADSWGSPDVDEAVSFQLATGAVDSDDGNMIQDTSLLANYKDHELRGLFFRMTSGALSGSTWKIKDNVGTWIILDTESDISTITATDTFEIFQGNIAKTFTGGNKRFMRVQVDAHHTADDYYQLGSMVAGEVITLNREWGKGWGKAHQYDIEMLRTPAGGMIPVKGADRKRVFQLGWNAALEVRKEIVALADYLEGKNLVLIPDSSDLTDCYLCKLIGGVSMKHVSPDRFQFTINLEEVL